MNGNDCASSEDVEDCVDRVLGESAPHELRMLARLYLRRDRAQTAGLEDMRCALSEHMAREEEYRKEISAFHERIESRISDFTTMVERGRGAFALSAWIGGFVGFIWLLVQVVEKAASWVRG